MAYPFGMAGCISGGEAASLATAEQSKAFETGSVRYGFKISKTCVKCEVGDLSFGQAAATGIVARDTEILHQLGKAGSPDGARSIVFKMVEPGCDLDQSRAVACRRIGDACPIKRPAEANLAHSVTAPRNDVEG